MRISGLFGPITAIIALVAIAPAQADVSSGDLMYTDLFRWHGPDGTPMWREILAKFDCTEELTFYLWNESPQPSPIVIPATPAVDPVAAAASGGLVDLFDPTRAPGGGAPAVPFDPIGSPSDGAPTAVAAVPEPSTWAMLLLGFAGLGYAAVRRHKAPRDLFVTNETDAFVRQTASPAHLTARNRRAT
jgi:PEP-CTERM motif